MQLELLKRWKQLYDKFDFCFESACLLTRCQTSHAQPNMQHLLIRLSIDVSSSFSLIITYIYLVVNINDLCIKFLSIIINRHVLVVFFHHLPHCQPCSIQFSSTVYLTVSGAAESFPLPFTPLSAVLQAVFIYCLTHCQPCCRQLSSTV